MGFQVITYHIFKPHVEHVSSWKIFICQLSVFICLAVGGCHIINQITDVFVLIWGLNMTQKKGIIDIPLKKNISNKSQNIVICPSSPGQFPLSPLRFDDRQHFFDSRGRSIDHGFGAIKLSIHLGIHCLIEIIDWRKNIWNPVGQDDTTGLHCLGVPLQDKVVFSYVSQRRVNYWFIIHVFQKWLPLNCKLAEPTLVFPKRNTWRK